MKLWIAKHGRGFLPACDESEKLHRRMEVGECAHIKVIRVRDIVAHRRYWKLMEMCADNCERIEIKRGVFMAVRCKEDVHTAIKLCTGHYDAIFDADGREVACVPRPTSFEDMTADEWNEYWPRVLQVVGDQVLPGVSLPSVETEIMRCMGWASAA